VASKPGQPEKTILDDISFSVSPGEAIGILGESGAGKSTIGYALLQMLPPGFQLTRGTITLDGRQLLAMSNEEFRSVRGHRLSMIFQDSSTLNPVLRVRDQVAEVVRAHRAWTMSRCREEASAMLELVGLGGERLFSAYPHQLSGGQRQRVVIAQALVCNPDVVVADEPTASLDAATTREILDMIQDLRQQRGTAVIFISHQPEVLAYLSDRVVVLYGGQIVEEGDTEAIFTSPAHPYTRALLGCGRPIEDNGKPAAKPRWPFIPASVSLPTSNHRCVFEDRCSQRREVCSNSVPTISAIGPAHNVRCFEYQAEGA
jgi:oligopeptide/dipeptide ABC transporter ATP-binding protein